MPRVQGVGLEQDSKITWIRLPNELSGVLLSAESPVVAFLSFGLMLLQPK